MNARRVFFLTVWTLLCGIAGLSFSACSDARTEIVADTLPPRAQDSLSLLRAHHYTWGANFVVSADSVVLERLPIKGSSFVLRRGDRVVVAEFAVHPADSVDSVWVKLAHTQELQGWMREQALKEALVPADSISQAIHLFRSTHVAYFVIVIALFVAFCLYRIVRREKLYLLWFNDIDSTLPLLLCFLTAFNATLYESVQHFAPDMWEHFYYNPTLSPFDVPWPLAVFLAGLWLFAAVFLAMLDDLFRQLSPVAAICYLLGLMSCCIVCYVFFMLTTSFYVGYLFLLLLFALLWWKIRCNMGYKYRCGHCGAKLKEKGVCPACGALNR